MKNLVTKTAAALTLSLFAVSAQAVILELVDNGGFETGVIAPWAQESSGGTNALSTVGPHTGTYSVNLSPPAGPVAERIVQADLGAGLLTAGQTVELSFWLRGASVNGGVFKGQILSQGVSGISFTDNLAGAYFANTGWTEYTWTSTLGSDVTNGITLKLASECAPVAGCSSNVFLDDVSITAEVVPVPAAAWLFGSGLLGLVGFARRRKA